MKINLKALAIGNGWTDPINQFVHADYLHQVGLIDKETSRTISSLERNVVKLLKRNLFEVAVKLVDKLEHFILTTIGEDLFYNFLNIDVDTSDKDLSALFERADIREAIHVGANDFNGGEKVYELMSRDYLDTAVPYLVPLLSHYKVYYYSGQVDANVPFISVDNFLQKMRFSGSFEFRRAKRHQWKVGNQIAGYVTTAGNLTNILVRNAGHMVPQDQPKWGFDLFSRIVDDRQFF